MSKTKSLWCFKEVEILRWKTLVQNRRVEILPGKTEDFVMDDSKMCVSLIEMDLGLKNLSLFAWGNLS